MQNRQNFRLGSIGTVINHVAESTESHRSHAIVDLAVSQRHIADPPESFQNFVDELGAETVAFAFEMRFAESNILSRKRSDPYGHAHGRPLFNSRSKSSNEIDAPGSSSAAAIRRFTSSMCHAGAGSGRISSKLSHSLPNSDNRSATLRSSIGKSIIECAILDSLVAVAFLAVPNIDPFNLPDGRSQYNADT